MKTDDELVFQSAREARGKLGLRGALLSKLLSFERSIVLGDTPSHSTKSQSCEPRLLSAMAHMKREDRIHHYSFCIRFLSVMVQKDVKDLIKIEYEKPMVYVNAFQRSGLLGLLEKTLLIIDLKRECLVIGVSGKKEERVSLKNYLMRQSKDPKKHCLIFDAIAKEEPRVTLRLFFEDYIFPQAKRTLKKLMEEVEKSRLFEELRRSSKAADRQLLPKAREPETEMNFLSGENIHNFRSVFETLKENQDEITPTDRLELFSCSYKSITTNGNTYFLQELFYLSKEELLFALSFQQHGWNLMCQDSVILESTPTELVFCENYIHNDRVYSATYIMSSPQEANKGRFLIRSVRNEAIDVDHPLRIDFAYLKVTRITSETSQLNVKVKMDTMDSSRETFIVDYLKQFSNLYRVLTSLKEKKKAVNLFKKQSNETVYYDAVGGEELPLHQEMNFEDLFNPKKENSDTTSSQGTASESMNYEVVGDLEKEFQYLRHRHCGVPASRKPCELMKEHYLDREWVRGKNGGLLCINERILSEQKKVLKHVFTTFGKNLLHNKGIMNISLPVTVCTKISHLKMIANNFIYAPLLLEPTLDSSALSRMKSLLVLLITIGNTGISSEKPFNPILGETYQGVINGCPIYLEQISHHPPCSAYLFQGRGYRVMGTIQPRVEATGINSVRCFSERENRVEFDEGSVVYLSFPKINLKGLLFGNREFCFEGKNFIFDQKNLLFAELNYGPRKNSFFGGSKDPVDLVSGKIFKVIPEFCNLFRGPKPQHFPLKEHIMSELADFEGTWTSQLRFNGQEVFNFKTQLPCILEDTECPLPSDSVLRTDILRLCEEKPKEAQVEKDRLEDLQRRDKTLREKCKKSQHP